MREGAVLIVCLALGILQVLGKPEAGAAPWRLLDPQCARELNLGTRHRIINGTNADILANPWMVQIIEAGTFVCGGALISNRYVLTAAHCRGGSILRMKVRLGDYNMKSRFDCTDQGCIPRVKDFAVTYVFTSEYTNDFHVRDLALLRLAETVEYSVNIRPVCLPIGGSPNSRWNLVQRIPSFRITGWGRTATAQVSYVLQHTSLQNYDNRHCEKVFRRQLNSNYICAGSATSSTCRGDSGGPLTAKSLFNGKNYIFLFGLVSYGLTSCRGPSVFTNVLPYGNWIVDKINRNP